MKAPWAAILVGLLAMVSAEARGQTGTVYVPVFDVVSEHVSYPDGPPFKEAWRSWTSHLSAFNGAGETVEVSTERLFGPDGERTLSQPLRTVLLPGVSREVALPTRLQGWEDPVKFAVVAVPPATTVFADVERRLFVSMPCNAPEPTAGDGFDLGEGRAPLPVFEAPFPAGARVMAGPVDLGNPHVYLDCASGPHHYGRRRLNVTLLNAGDADAVFVIKAFRMGTLSADAGPVLVRSVPLGAKRVYQVNDVPIFDAIVESKQTLHDQELAWVTVEATQPFLAYVSSVFIDPEPATLPFQVFAPRLMP